MYCPKALGLSCNSITGDEVQCICPYHDDHEPSASYNIVKGVFFCYTCGTAKTAKQIARDLDGVLAQISSEEMAIWKRSVGDDAAWRALLKNSPVFGHSLDYLLARNINKSTARHFGLLHRHMGVVVPLQGILSKQILGVQVRQIGQKPKYLTYGAKPTAWPIQHLQQRPIEKPLFIVEGVFSVMLAYQYGHLAIATLGAGSVSGLAMFLNGNSAMKENVYTLFDPDRAGLSGAVKMWNEANIPAIMLTRPPDECSERDWGYISSVGPSHAVKGESKIVNKYFEVESRK